VCFSEFGIRVFNFRQLIDDLVSLKQKRVNTGPNRRDQASAFS
ncbi:unnamed protein product, partial [Larinioides sclopetarius]